MSRPSTEWPITRVSSTGDGTVVDVVDVDVVVDVIDVLGIVAVGVDVVVVTAVDDVVAGAIVAPLELEGSLAAVFESDEQAIRSWTAMTRPRSTAIGASSSATRLTGATDLQLDGFLTEEDVNRGR